MREVGIGALGGLSRARLIAGWVNVSSGLPIGSDTGCAQCVHGQARPTPPAFWLGLGPTRMFMRERGREIAALENEFHRAMVTIYETQKDYGYYATYFKQMLDQYGGVQAAKRLLAGHEVQQGLMTLWELGHLDNSVEAHVIQPRFQPLFTEEGIEEARRRLEELGYFNAS